jgi:hypothetical protein
MLANTSSVKYRQGLVDGDPYQPTAESALAIECRDMVRSREKTILYSNIGSIRIAKHAVCDKMEQAAISRCPDIERRALVRRTFPDRSSFMQLWFHIQCWTHFTP